MRHQVNHSWAQDLLESQELLTLQGRRMGIVGLGSIGMEVARLAARLGLEGISDPPPRESRAARRSRRAFASRSTR